MTTQHDPDHFPRADRLTAAQARAEWTALVHEAGLVGDFSFEGLLDRLERVVLDR